MTLRILLVLLVAAGARGQDSVSLAPGQTVEREISSPLVFAVALREGEFAALEFDNRGGDFLARMISPAGSDVQFHAPEREDGRETEGFVAMSAGIHHLEIKPAYRNSPTRFGVRLKEIRPASETDRRVFEVLTLSTEVERLYSRRESISAIPLAVRALEIAEAEFGPNDAEVARLSGTLGNLYWIEGAFSDGEPLLRRAIALDEKLFGPMHPETLLNSARLGGIYQSVSDYAKAEPLIERALEVTRSLGGEDHPTVAKFLVDSARLHQEQGDSALAEAEYLHAIRILGRSLDPDTPEALYPMNDLAVLYNSQKKYERAEPLLQRVIEAVQASQGADSPQLALPLWNLALIEHEYRKDYARALELYQRALTLLEKGAGTGDWRRGSILNNMANIYKSQGQFAKALEMHTRVHGLWERSLGPYDGRTLLSLGNIARTYAEMGDAANAVKYQALTDEAIEKNLEMNLAAGSERQKLAYFQTLSQRTDRTITLHTKLAADSQEAIRLGAMAALQRKGRVLDAMSLNLASMRQRMDPQGQGLLDAWNSATSGYARLALRGQGTLSAAEYQRQLADLATKRDTAEAAMIRRSSEFGAQAQPVTLAAIQAAIPQDAALIEFAVWRPFDPHAGYTGDYGEPRYVAYVIRASGDVQWKDLGAAKEIDPAVSRFRAALGNPDRGDVRQLARVLDRKVMAPLRALAGNAKQLLVSPEGPLNLVPFQALIDGQGRYLIERYSVAYLSSGRDLLRLQVERPSHSGPVIFADPFFGEPDNQLISKATPSPRRSVTTGTNLKDLYFAPLAGTGREASAIQTLFPESRLLAGKQATEAALKQVNAPRILHIATHGFFLSAAAGNSGLQNPLLRSGLAMANANRRNGADDDGIFTAIEATGLNLWGTKLVTLSACDTGVGEVKSGEGVYGLRRALVLAGAETLVMSLWPVSDSVTREIMAAFYSGLRKGLGRGEALRQAQLAVLRQNGREHPFYWAGFIESGEWANLNGRR